MTMLSKSCRAIKWFKISTVVYYSPVQSDPNLHKLINYLYKSFKLTIYMTRYKKIISKLCEVIQDG